MTRVLLLIVTVFALGACNTLEGFGEDVSAGARAVDRAI